MFKKIGALFLVASAAILVCQKDNHRSDIESIFSWFKGEYAIVIVKKKFKLYVYDRRANKVASYLVGYGSNPDMKAKLYEGDKRTPEGTYHITEIQSLDVSKESEACRKLTKMNKVYFSAVDGFHKYNQPHADLGDNAFGPRFFRINYPNNDDKKRYEVALQEEKIPEKNGKKAAIGCGLAIHGTNDESSIGHLCSRGCIRMYNRDIIELEKYSACLTPVVIYAE